MAALVAGRYARAFAEVVVERKMDSAQAMHELNSVADLVKSSLELRNVLQNPSVPRQQKLGLLDAIIARMDGSKMLRNFIAVLIDQHRIGQIDEIAEQFKRELDRRLGIAEAQISSVRELAQEEKQLLEKKIGAITGKVIRATYSRDPSLLGGAVVRVGSTIYDGSVRGQLLRLKQQIMAS
jgi:F-type H+-transporting ATPase subunit delta